MFCGIVEELGEVVRREPGRLTLAARLAAELRPGESVAVSGVCVSVVSIASGAFSADVMPETERRTSLGALRAKDPVNLERSLQLGERVSGHLVSGHVDGTGTVTAVRGEGESRHVTIAAEPRLLAFVAPQGSIAVDGISLTVVDASESAFSVALIPLTLRSTTAGGWQEGRTVNLEVDQLARYVHRALEARDATSVTLPGAV